MEIAHSTDNFRFASLRQRLKAFLFDYLIILAYVVVLAGVNYGLILSKGMLEDISPIFASPWIKDGLAFLTLILPVTLYFTFFESSSQQATCGKRRVGLRVVNANGERITQTRAFIRNLLKFLPWQLGHTSVYQVLATAPGQEPTTLNMAGFVLTYLLVGLYLASALISKKHRTPYDWAAGSLVILERDVAVNSRLSYRELGTIDIHEQFCDTRKAIDPLEMKIKSHRENPSHEEGRQIYSNRFACRHQPCTSIRFCRLSGRVCQACPALGRCGCLRLLKVSQSSASRF